MARDVQQENIYERKTKVIQKWGVLSYMTFSIITLHNNSCCRGDMFMVFDQDISGLDLIRK